MGDTIKTIEVTFPENGFYASPALKENKKAFDLLREAFSGKSMHVNVSHIPDEDIKKFVKSDPETDADFEAAMENLKKKRTSLIFGLDFDNTCVFEEYPNVGSSVPGAIETLRDLVDRGHRIILWTCRGSSQLDDAIKWFSDNKIILYAINEMPEDDIDPTYPTVPRKIFPDYFIDDRNLGCPMRVYKVDGKTYKAVDWEILREIMKERNII